MIEQNTIYISMIICIIATLMLFNTTGKVNLRIHTMMAFGIVWQRDVKTTYIYIGPFLISLHNLKKKKK